MLGRLAARWPRPGNTWAAAAAASSSVLPDALDRSSDAYARNATAIGGLLSDLRSRVSQVLGGGGSGAVKPQRARALLDGYDMPTTAPAPRGQSRRGRERRGHHARAAGGARAGRHGRGLRGRPCEAVVPPRGLLHLQIISGLQNFDRSNVASVVTAADKHVPRTNGDIPSFDEAFSDHRRLLDRCLI
ncbi:hypothetical protein ACQJBY_012988 [Aegilops geniculata]